MCVSLPLFPLSLTLVFSFVNYTQWKDAWSRERDTDAGFFPNIASVYVACSHPNEYMTTVRTCSLPKSRRTHTRSIQTDSLPKTHSHKMEAWTDCSAPWKAATKNAKRRPNEGAHLNTFWVKQFVYCVSKRETNNNCADDYRTGRWASGLARLSLSLSLFLWLSNLFLPQRLRATTSSRLTLFCVCMHGLKIILVCVRSRLVHWIWTPSWECLCVCKDDAFTYAQIRLYCKLERWEGVLSSGLSSMHTAKKESSQNVVVPESLKQRQDDHW